MNVAVDGGGTREAIHSRDRGRAAPAKVVLLDFLALRVMADSTFTLVAAQGRGAFLLGGVGGRWTRGAGRLPGLGAGRLCAVLHVSSSGGVKSAPTNANRSGSEKIFVEIRSR